MKPNFVLTLTLAALTAGCATTGMRDTAPTFQALRVTEHRDGDDLLTAGLGLDGLRAMTPAPFADAARPTPAELRRRAIWANWRGIADLSPGGGYGALYGSTATVPGREYHAFARVPGARQPHRVAVQIPDAFDTGKRCVVVAPASGSRGVYGAIAVGGAWGLPKGCAVAYTDKGAGTDYFDLDAGQGVAIDGTVASVADAPLAFAPDAAAGAAGVRGIAVKHAHSQDNPEAAWGLHVRQAAEFALHALNEAFPQAAPFRFDDTRVIAVGISNGGGAVLRAAEDEEPWLDAVVAGEPNVTVAGAIPLYDYATEAALLMPCALKHMGIPLPPAAGDACAAALEAGLVTGADDETRQRHAYEQLRARGWTAEALRGGAISVGFDLWRAVAATYASAYGRFGVDEHPCGIRFAAVDRSGQPRAASDAERAAWWADASGIPPGAGVQIVQGGNAGLFPLSRTRERAGARAGAPAVLDQLSCLRALWTSDTPQAYRVRAGIAETRARAPRPGLPVFVVHGRSDGLIPAAFTSVPYVRHAHEAGRDVRYWQVANAQHFDAFLGLPVYAARYVPLLPYVYEALDRTWAHLESGAPLPADADVPARPRDAGAPLGAEHLAVPRE